MIFQTPVIISRPNFLFSYDEECMLIGSCFVENIGKMLEAYRFPTDINPFGVLYNPASIASALQRLLEQTPYGDADLFEHEGIYHSFDHHSSFSSASKKDCLQEMNERLQRSGAYLKRAGRLIITFGTAYVYHRKDTGKIVANCHKLPENLFKRTRLAVDAIVEEWSPLIQQLESHNKTLKILFTVSPIRHWKDGAHANQLSKSTLLLAIERLREISPSMIDYFPAYEIMMDELRDYRYYADDMLHPSPLAIQYIWERFTENYLTDETKTVLKEVTEIEKALAHKPFHPGSQAYGRFLAQTLLKMEQIRKKRQYLYTQNDINAIRSKLS